MHLVGRKKLNHGGAVATIIGLPLAILLAWAAQATAGSDTVRVNSSNQQGGITANTVNITTPPGALQPAPSNKALAISDKELLAQNLTNLNNGIQGLRESYEECKQAGIGARCKMVLNGIESQTALFNKMCRDNEVPRGNYGCP